MEVSKELFRNGMPVHLALRTQSGLCPDDEREEDSTEDPDRSPCMLNDGVRCVAAVLAAAPEASGFSLSNPTL